MICKDSVKLFQRLVSLVQQNIANIVANVKQMLIITRIIIIIGPGYAYEFSIRADVC